MSLLDDLDARDRAFSALMSRFGTSIRRFFLLRGFDRSEAEVLTQDVFLHAYRGMDSYRYEAESSWLFVIALNIYRNAIRQQRTEMRSAEVIEIAEAAETASEAFVAPDEDPLSALISREMSQAVAEAVERLPTSMRQCLRLYLEGFKYRDIAELLGISIDTVKSHLSQAKARLRHQLYTNFSSTKLS